MVLFHKQSGPLYFEMQNGSSALAEKIRKENPADAYKDVLRWLDAIPAAQKAAGKSAADAAQVQRHYAGMAFGDEDMAQLTSKGMSGYNEAYAQASQDVGQITAEMVKQSEAFDRSISRFDASWNNLKRDLGSTVLPGLTAATDGMRKLFDEVKAEPALLGVGAGAAVGLYARAAHHGRQQARRGRQRRRGNVPPAGSKARRRVKRPPPQPSPRPWASSASRSPSCAARPASPSRPSP